MPYDVTIITVKPNTHLKALPGVEQWLKANPRKGEFLGLPRVRDRRPEQDHAAAPLRERGRPRGRPRRRRAGRKPVRLPRPDDRAVDRHLRPVPFPAADPAGPVRPDLRGARPICSSRRPAADHRGLGEAARRRGKSSHRSSPRCIRSAAKSRASCISGPIRAWRCARSTRKTAIETGVWPPPGGPDHLLTMHTDIFLPAPFSPIR